MIRSNTGGDHPKRRTSLDAYFREIKAMKPLTPAQEIDLARRIHKGEQEAMDILLEHNLRFVVTVAKRYQGQGLYLEDLINEGNLGLIKAAQRFDETRGFKFISYAVWWIRQSILAAIASNARLVRLPQNVVGRLGKLNKIAAKLAQELEREPTTFELAEAANLPIGKVEAAGQFAGAHYSLDSPVSEDMSTLQDLLPGEGLQPDAPLVHESVHWELERALAHLASREQEVVRRYFGLGYEQSYTLDEIGKILGLTRERVRQIKEKAIRKLRHLTRDKTLLGALS